MKKEKDIAISKSISQQKPSIDKEKYNLIDETKSLEELRTQVYLTKNILEKMQIFDFLLNKNYVFGKNALAEHFKHGVSEGPRLVLLQEAVRQDKYLKIKEWCLYKMIQYEEKKGRIESALAYADSLRALFPENKLLDQRDYSKLTTVVSEVKKIMSDESLDKPARLFQLGNAYMKVGFLFWKLWPGDYSLAYKYFNELLQKYPESPYIVNARFTMIEHEYGIATEDIVDSSCGLSIAKKYETLLRKYPETTIRSEVLLRIAEIYIFKTKYTLELYPDSALYYLNKADSCFSQIIQIPQEENLLRKLFWVEDAIKEYRFKLGEP